MICVSKSTRLALIANYSWAVSPLLRALAFPLSLSPLSDEANSLTAMNNAFAPAPAWTQAQT